MLHALFRLMPSLTCSPDTTWSSIDITSAFLNAEIHEEDLASLQAPVQDEIVAIDAATMKNAKLHYNSEQNLINLPAVGKSLITRDPDTCFI